MRLLDGYLKSLKPLDIEEPIDVWVHRPLAYLPSAFTLPDAGESQCGHRVLHRLWDCGGEPRW